MSFPNRPQPKPDPVPVPNDPTQRVDELITQMRHFKEVKKLLRLNDSDILAYCWAQGTPDKDGPYISPLMRRDDQGVFSVPIEQRTIGGTLRVYHVKFLNDGINAGNHSIIIQAAAGSPMEVLWASVKNTDTAARAVTIHISSAGGVEVRILITNATTGAGDSEHWPAVLDTGHSKLPINEELRFQTLAAAIAVSQDTEHCIVYRYFGDTAPTITTSEPVGCTVTEIA